MKLFILLVCLAFCGLSHGQLSQKISFINTTAVFADMPELKAADEQMEAFARKLQQQDSAKVTAFQKKVDLFQKQQSQGLLAPAEADKQKLALENERDEIMRFENQMTNEADAKRSSLYAPIQDKLKKAIATVAKENGYTCVFDTGMENLLYADESYRLDNLVRKKLGLPEKK